MIEDYRSLLLAEIAREQRAWRPDRAHMRELLAALVKHDSAPKENQIEVLFRDLAAAQKRLTAIENALVIRKTTSPYDQVRLG